MSNDTDIVESNVNDNNNDISLNKTLFSLETKNTLFEFNVENGTNVKYFVINNIPIDSDLEINFKNINTNNNNILYKIRISNYKFFPENFNLTNTLKLYMNKFIHYLILLI